MEGRETTGQRKKTDTTRGTGGKSLSELWAVGRVFGALRMRKGKTFEGLGV